MHKHIDGNTLLKGQAQVSAANETRTRRRNYPPNEDERLQYLKAHPTTSISSTYSDLSDLMALPTEILQTTPHHPQAEDRRNEEDDPTEALQSTESESTTSTESATTTESTDSATTVGSMASTESMATPTRTDVQDRAEATRKSTTQISPPPDADPLNYVAALRIRQERGRHRSPDLFEEY